MGAMERIAGMLAQTGKVRHLDEHEPFGHQPSRDAAQGVPGIGEMFQDMSQGHEIQGSRLDFRILETACNDIDTIGRAGEGGIAEIGFEPPGTASRPAHDQGELSG